MFQTCDWKVDNELWTQWTTDTVLPDGSILVAASGMCGNPGHSEIALRVAGEGQFYGCVEAAIADLARYFMAEEPPEPVAP